MDLSSRDVRGSCVVVQYMDAADKVGVGNRMLFRAGITTGPYQNIADALWGLVYGLSRDVLRQHFPSQIDLSSMDYK